MHINQISRSGFFMHIDQISRSGFSIHIDQVSRSGFFMHIDQISSGRRLDLVSIPTFAGHVRKSILLFYSICSMYLLGVVPRSDVSRNKAKRRLQDDSCRAAYINVWPHAFHLHNES